jgi:hypothetical protein
MGIRAVQRTVSPSQAHTGRILRGEQCDDGVTRATLTYSHGTIYFAISLATVNYRKTASETPLPLLACRKTPSLAEGEVDM